MTAGETHRTIEATFRIERARLIAGLVRLARDIDRAEELAQDALVIALAEWPRTGVPASPGAWLMTAAKRRAIDVIGATGCVNASMRQSGGNWRCRLTRNFSFPPRMRRPSYRLAVAVASASASR